MCLAHPCSSLWCMYRTLRLFLPRHTSKEVRRLWEKGLPPSIRGEIWVKAIGNRLDLSQGMCPNVWVAMFFFPRHPCVWGGGRELHT